MTRGRLHAALVLLLLAAGCASRESQELSERLDRLEKRLDTVESSAELSARLSAMELRLKGGGPGAPVAAVSQPRSDRFGGEYRQGVATDPPGLDPAHDTDTASWRVALNLFEGLVELEGKALSVAPCIARTWETSADGTVFIFRLRDDVRFHNGRPCEAVDFVYSFRRLLEPATASERAWIMEEVLGVAPFQALDRARAILGNVSEGHYDKVEAPRVASTILGLEHVSRVELERAGVPAVAAVVTLGERALEIMRTVSDALRKGKTGLASCRVEPDLLASLRGLRLADFLTRGLTAPDRWTLRIELARPFAPFLSLLTLPNAAVVPAEVVAKLGDDFARHPVGTGPFRFASWVPHVSLELEAFDGYFRGRPYLDRLKFRVLPDPIARLYEFEIGNLEQINEVPDEKYEAIRGNPNYPGVMEETVALSTFYIGFNVTKKPFDDVRVRRAFNYAANKEVILKVLRHNRGTIAKGVLPPGMPGRALDLTEYPYDPKRAVALLKEAGYDDPRKLGLIEYWYNATAPNDPNAQLAEVIQQNLREIGVDTKLQSSDWGSYLGKLDRGDAPMFRLGWVALFPDPDTFMFPLFHSTMHGQSGNTTFYSDPKVDEMLERARTTLDPAVRMPLYQALEKKIVEDAPWIFLFHGKPALLRKSRVHGIELTPVGPDAVPMRGVWLEKG